MKEHFHLKGLDGLRAVAAVAVVISHIELIKKGNKLSNYSSHIENWGNLGVVLFFVLSGFLITTLLLKEKKSENSINLKYFYLRRILRIWPLYFLILMLSAYIFNYSPSWLTLLLCSTIFPNFAHALASGWTVSPQIWSIGVEEQFYLFWPTILKQKHKTVILFCVLFIFIYPFFPHIIQFSLNKLGHSSNTLKLVEKIMEVLNFNAMATGALFSILYFQKNKFFNKLINLSKILNYAVVIFTLILWFSSFNFGFYQIPLFSFLFAIMIVLIINGTLTSYFEIKALRFLGKISYGIYMYHWIILLLLMKLLKPKFNQSILIPNILMYSSVIILTILAAFLSYELFEKKFLKLKSRLN
ncbi:MAG: acyltransferase [Crocinitomicaceae bacterium]